MYLSNLNDVNHLIRYGLVLDDEENKKISLHLICLAHGLEVRRPENVIQALIGIVERVDVTV